MPPFVRLADRSAIALAWRKTALIALSLGLTSTACGCTSTRTAITSTIRRLTPYGQLAGGQDQASLRANSAVSTRARSKDIPGLARASDMDDPFLQEQLPSGRTQPQVPSQTPGHVHIVTRTPPRQPMDSALAENRGAGSAKSRLKQTLAQDQVQSRRQQALELQQAELRAKVDQLLTKSRALADEGQFAEAERVALRAQKLCDDAGLVLGKNDARPIDLVKLIDDQRAGRAESAVWSRESVAEESFSEPTVNAGSESAVAVATLTPPEVDLFPELDPSQLTPPGSSLPDIRGFDPRQADNADVATQDSNGSAGSSTADGWTDGPATVPEPKAVAESFDAALPTVPGLAVTPAEREKVSTGRNADSSLEVTAAAKPATDVVVAAAAGQLRANAGRRASSPLTGVSAEPDLEREFIPALAFEAVTNEPVIAPAAGLTISRDDLPSLPGFSGELDREQPVVVAAQRPPVLKLPPTETRVTTQETEPLEDPLLSEEIASDDSETGSGQWWHSWPMWVILGLVSAAGVALFGRGGQRIT